MTLSFPGCPFSAPYSYSHSWNSGHKKHLCWLGHVMWKTCCGIYPCHGLLLASGASISQESFCSRNFQKELVRLSTPHSFLHVWGPCSGRLGEETTANLSIMCVVSHPPLVWRIKLVASTLSSRFAPVLFVTIVDIVLSALINSWWASQLTGS